MYHRSASSLSTMAGKPQYALSAEKGVVVPDPLPLRTVDLVFAFLHAATLAAGTERMSPGAKPKLRIDFNTQATALLFDMLFNSTTPDNTTFSLIDDRVIREKVIVKSGSYGVKLLSHKSAVQPNQTITMAVIESDHGDLAKLLKKYHATDSVFSLLVHHTEDTTTGLARQLSEKLVPQLQNPGFAIAVCKEGRLAGAFAYRDAYGQTALIVVPRYYIEDELVGNFVLYVSYPVDRITKRTANGYFNQPEVYESPDLRERLLGRSRYPWGLMASVDAPMNRVRQIVRLNPDKKVSTLWVGYHEPQCCVKFALAQQPGTRHIYLHSRESALALFRADRDRIVTQLNTLSRVAIECQYTDKLDESLERVFTLSDIGGETDLVIIMWNNESGNAKMVLQTICQRLGAISLQKQVATLVFTTLEAPRDEVFADGFGAPVIGLGSGDSFLGLPSSCGLYLVEPWSSEQRYEHDSFTMSSVYATTLMHQALSIMRPYFQSGAGMYDFMGQELQEFEFAISLLPYNARKTEAMVGNDSELEILQTPQAQYTRALLLDNDGQATDLAGLLSAASAILPDDTSIPYPTFGSMRVADLDYYIKDAPVFARHFLLQLVIAMVKASPSLVEAAIVAFDQQLQSQPLQLTRRSGNNNPHVTIIRPAVAGSSSSTGPSDQDIGASLDAALFLMGQDHGDDTTNPEKRAIERMTKRQKKTVAEEIARLKVLDLLIEQANDQHLIDKYTKEYEYLRALILFVQHTPRVYKPSNLNSLEASNITSSIGEVIGVFASADTTLSIDRRPCYEVFGPLLSKAGYSTMPYNWGNTYQSNTSLPRWYNLYFNYIPRFELVGGISIDRDLVRAILDGGTGHRQRIIKKRILVTNGETTTLRQYLEFAAKTLALLAAGTASQPRTQAMVNEKINEGFVPLVKSIEKFHANVTDAEFAVKQRIATLATKFNDMVDKLLKQRSAKAREELSASAKTIKELYASTLDWKCRLQSSLRAHMTGYRTLITTYAIVIRAAIESRAVDMILLKEAGENVALWSETVLDQIILLASICETSKNRIRNMIYQYQKVRDTRNVVKGYVYQLAFGRWLSEMKIEGQSPLAWIMKRMGRHTFAKRDYWKRIFMTKHLAIDETEPTETRPPRLDLSPRNYSLYTPSSEQFTFTVIPDETEVAYRTIRDKMFQYGKKAVVYQAWYKEIVEVLHTILEFDVTKKTTDIEHHFDPAQEKGAIQNYLLGILISKSKTITTRMMARKPKPVSPMTSYIKRLYKVLSNTIDEPSIDTKLLDGYYKYLINTVLAGDDIRMHELRYCVRQYQARVVIRMKELIIKLPFITSILLAKYVSIPDTPPPGLEEKYKMVEAFGERATKTDDIASMFEGNLTTLDVLCGDKISTIREPVLPAGLPAMTIDQQHTFAAITSTPGPIVSRALAQIGISKSIAVYGEIPDKDVELYYKYNADVAGLLIPETYLKNEKAAKKTIKQRRALVVWALSHGYALRWTDCDHPFDVTFEQKRMACRYMDIPEYLLLTEEHVETAYAMRIQHAEDWVLEEEPDDRNASDYNLDSGNFGPDVADDYMPGLFELHPMDTPWFGSPSDEQTDPLDLLWRK